MDNFFSSVPLFLQLLQHKTYACGTLRSNRKFLPKALQQTMKRGLPNRGDFKYMQDENLVATVWQDTKPVSALSTNWDPTNVTKVRRKKKDGTTIEVKCPNIIAL